MSTLSPLVLNKLIPSTISLPHLDANAYSSVTVVNMVFPTLPDGPPLHPAGFGYLIPRSSSDDVVNQGILGAVFDSSATSPQDTGELKITKLTVMLGGPYPLTPYQTSLPVILEHLSQHLGHNLPQPLLVRTHAHKECIPILSVGHLERMDKLRGVLQGQPWDGRLEVIGAGICGVSVGDCVEAGKRAGQHWD